MQRKHLIAAAAVGAVALGWIVWKATRGGGGDGDGATGSAAGDEELAPGLKRLLGRQGDPGAPGRVEGRVLDMADRRPLAGVDVTFGAPLGESTATSGADGRYSLELSPGSYRVQAMGDGVFGAAAGAFTLRPGQAVKDFDILVSRLATLRGKVVDHHGAPVAGAAVSYSSRLGGKPIGTNQTAPIGEATSDEAGRFEIEVLAGEVRLMAELGESRGAAVVGAVVPGQEPAEVIITLPAGAAVAGRVVDQSGAAVPGAEVRASGRGVDGVFEKIAEADAAGGFRFEHLAAGRTYLEARAQGAVSAPVPVKLVDGAEKTGVSLVLGGAVAIAGRVVDGKGRPIGGASVRVVPRRTTFKQQSVTTGADGTFRLEGLSAGGRYVVSARADGFAIAFASDTAAPVDQLELVLVSAGGIRGVVKGAGGRSVQSFEVQVNRFAAHNGKVRSGQTGSRFTTTDGTFELDLVEPGEYQIVVTAPGHAPARPPPIAVPPDGWGEVVVELAGAATVAGRVTSKGAPVAGARVAMAAGYEGPPVFTDAQGRFQLIDVVPGTRSISASKSGLVTAHRDGVEVKAGQTVEVELSLAASDKQEGTIGVVLGSTAQARPSVVSAASRGSAYKAGVRGRDVVVAIDGITTANMPVDQATELLRGPVGAAVRLDVERDAKPMRFDIVRR